MVKCGYSQFTATEGDKVHTKLRRRRIELELDQTQLAEILGVGQTSISNWERGYTTPRGFPMKRKLEAVLGMPLYVLLQNENSAATNGDAAGPVSSATVGRYV
jgi:transcriptional regulator with XRE-family HTH domain